MKPYLYGPKIMWNIDCSVGKGGTNSVRCDVEFIQWYYTLARDFALTTPQNKAVYRDVQLNGVCTGKDNDPLVRAIMAQQRDMNHTVDGRVSVVTGSGKVGNYAFFLLRLEARMGIMYPKAWPRLDLIPNCPSSVVVEVQKALPQMSELGGP